MLSRRGRSSPLGGWAAALIFPAAGRQARYKTRHRRRFYGTIRNTCGTNNFECFLFCLKPRIRHTTNEKNKTANFVVVVMHITNYEPRDCGNECVFPKKCSTEFCIQNVFWMNFEKVACLVRAFGMEPGPARAFHRKTRHSKASQRSHNPQPSLYLLWKRPRCAGRAPRSGSCLLATISISNLR